MPWAFAVSAVLLIVEWVLTFAAPKLAAVLVYLHISGLGPILGSGFWLVTTERFDPRTAKRKFGQIAGGGTFGGCSADSWPSASPYAWRRHDPAGARGAQSRVRLAGRTSGAGAGVPPQSEEFSAELTPEPAWSGVRVLAETPYLRHLALLVLLGTTGAALIDYAFKVQAVAALGSGESLLRFFGAYYAAVSLVTFVVQTSMSRVRARAVGARVHQRDSVARAVCRRLGALVAPGLQGRLSRAAGVGLPRLAVPRCLRSVLHAFALR